jgi:hypothetical protein
MRRVLTGVLVVAALLSACGGGDGTTGGSDDPAEQPAGADDTSGDTSDGDGPDATTAVTLSDEEIAYETWSEGADAVCADLGRATDSLPLPEAPDDLEVLAIQASDFQAAATEDLAALGLPDDRAEAATRLFELFTARARVIVDLAVAAGADDQEALEEVSDEGSAIDVEIVAVSTELGLDDCVAMATVGDEDEIDAGGTTPTTG